MFRARKNIQNFSYTVPISREIMLAILSFSTTVGSIDISFKSYKVTHENIWILLLGQNGT